MAPRGRPNSTASRKRPPPPPAQDRDDDDEGGLGEVHQPKRVKMGVSGSSGSSSKVDSNGDLYWELSKQRRVTISSFRNKTLVNIREYYEKDGQGLPGKKGISMTIEQFNNLISLLPDIEAVLSQKGESVPRPKYPDATESEDPPPQQKTDENSTAAPSGKTTKKEPRKKRNIETTSDEDEDETESEE